MASKNNFPHGHLVMHLLFSSTVFLIGFPRDSTQTIKGLVNVMCLIPSFIAKLEYFNHPKVS